MSPTGTASSSTTARRPRRISAANRYWRSAAAMAVEPRIWYGRSTRPPTRGWTSTQTASNLPWCPKQACALVHRYALLVVEDLQIAQHGARGQTCRRSRQPRPLPGQRSPGEVRAQRNISDAGWGQFVSLLPAKAEDAGCIWIEVGPRHTSDGCELCGHAAAENGVTQADSSASAAVTPLRPTNMPHATFFGLDWPFTPKGR